MCPKVSEKPRRALKVSCLVYNWMKLSILIVVVCVEFVSGNTQKFFHINEL